MVGGSGAGVCGAAAATGGGELRLVDCGGRLGAAAADAGCTGVAVCGTAVAGGCMDAAVCGMAAVGGGMAAAAAAGGTDSVGDGCGGSIIMGVVVAAADRAASEERFECDISNLATPMRV